MKIGQRSKYYTVNIYSWFYCRLDFEQFTLAGPEPINHICNYDQFIVSGSSTVPIICGVNSGNHSMFEL